MLRRLSLDVAAGCLVFGAAASWLQFASLPIARFGLLGPVFAILILWKEGTALRRSFHTAVADSPLIWGFIIPITSATVVALMVNSEPYYGSWVFNSSVAGVLTGFGALVAVNVATSGKVESRCVQAFGWSAAASFVMVAVLLPAVFGGLGMDALDLFASFDNGSLLDQYRTAFWMLRSSDLFDIASDRSTNLRHEPALMLAVAAPAVALSTNKRSLAAVLWLLLLLSLSRSAIAAAALSIFVLSARQLRSSRQAQGRVAFTVMLLVGVFWATSGAVSDRFSGEEDRSADIRGSAVELAFAKFGVNPVGVDVADLGDMFTPPHVFVLDASLGAGWLGIVAALTVLAYLVLRSLRLLRHIDRSIGPIDALAISAASVALVRYFTAGSFLRNMATWLALGLLVRHAPLSRPTNQQLPQPLAGHLSPVRPAASTTG